jgi:dipeptidyl aminopeptidase/acylaminoacyl peptidase
MLNLFRWLTSQNSSRKTKGLKLKQDAINLLDLQSGATLYFFPAKDQETQVRPAVLIVHGYGSSAYSTTYALLRDELSTAGFHTFSLSLRGHDFAVGTKETVSRADHEQDIREAIEQMQVNPLVDHEKISAVGASYGAYLLANVLKEFAFQNLVFRAPALYPDGDWNQPISEIVDTSSIMTWRKLLHTTSEVQVLKSFADFKGHVLLVLSELDEQMPPRVSDSYIKAFASSRLMRVELPEAKHALKGEERNEFATMATNFLLANLK